VIIVGVLMLMMGYYHNKIVAVDEQVKATWGQVLNQYKRRADLIPNLVNTVKAYAKHEKELFIGVANARAKVGQMSINAASMVDNPQLLESFKGAQGELSSMLSRLMVVVEKYPEIKADKNFQALQSQLEGTENRISVARRDYIDAVRVYNILLRKYPSALFIKMTDSELKQRVAMVEEEIDTQVPNVNF